MKISAISNFPRIGAWTRRSLLVVCLALAMISAAVASAVSLRPASAPFAPTLVLMIDQAHSTLHWTLDSTLHMVHGTFALKRGEVTVDPASGKASGEIVADATSGQTGNDSRDKKMHQEILETPRFPEIVFRVSQIEGLTAPLAKAHLKLHGTFLIHGTQHDMTVPADAEFAGDHFSGTANFVVPYIDWGIKNPSNFLLKASPTVDVSLELSGSVRPPAK